MITPPSHKLTRWKWIPALVFALGLSLLGDRAEAHSLDMYAQSQSLHIQQDVLLDEWRLTPGPMLAYSAWEQADQNQDGQVSPQEARAWLAPFLAQWTVSLDGQAITPVQVQEIHWPDSVDVLQSGEDPIVIRLEVQWPSRLAGRHRIEIHNANQEPISLNSFSLTAGEGISFATPTQSNGLLEISVEAGGSSATSAGSGSVGLTSWDSGQPNLSGATGVLTGMAASLASPGNAPQSSAGLSGPTAALAGLVRTQNFSLLFLAGAFLLSLALGSLHALTPGHGKTLVAAYLVGSHGRTRDAVFLGSIVTLTHTGSVLIFGLLTMLASRYIFPTLITPWLEVISGLAVVGFGLSLFISRGRALYAWYRSERSRRTAWHFHDLRRAVSAQAATDRSAPAPVLGTGFHTHGLRPQPHAHSGVAVHAISEHDHAHPHEHVLASNQVTWRSLLTLGISGGLVPCPDAIAILVVAVAVNRIPLGMVLIVAFSLGLAFVLIGIGVAMVQGARFISRNDLLNRFSLYSPALSAVVVLGLGIFLSLSAFRSLQLSSNALQASQVAPSSSSTPVEFDLRTASLVFLAPDAQNEDQLSIVPLGGGVPKVLTQEPAGVDGYTLSPDGRSILYTTIQTDGVSSIWEVDLDGTQKRQVLDCPKAQCDQPVWLAGGGKAIYERNDYSQNSISPMFTIWWVDLASGRTEPVFQDKAFPALAPAFSQDGRWLCYISPSTNTIQGYNLLNGATFSIPVSNQSFAEVLWSPSSDSVLYFDPVDALSNGADHLKRYLLSSGQITDLGGAKDQADYLAAWSPDGEWIAIVRDAPAATGSTAEEEIWLVRPDGSQGHALVADQGFYSDLAWSPDGRYLVYTRTSIQGIGQSEIWLADIRSGQVKKLWTGGLTPALAP
jgi:ABC-type nickel/cobalt efflux system permease component RcnA